MVRTSSIPYSEIVKHKRFDAEFFLGGKIKCSLCDQEFYKADSQIKERKERHEELHDETKSHASLNQTWGKVEWLEVQEG